MTPVLRILYLLVAVTTLALAPQAHAAPLDDAKAAGYAGERPDGYLGIVPGQVPASVKQLVDEINLKRREEYKRIAGRTGASLQAVEVTAGKKLVERAKPGEYVMGPNGQWKKK